MRYVHEVKSTGKQLTQLLQTKRGDRFEMKNQSCSIRLTDDFKVIRDIIFQPGIAVFGDYKERNRAFVNKNKCWKTVF